MALVYPGMALPGSSFEGNDGNLVVDSAGNTDWSNAPNRVRGDDLPSGTGDKLVRAGHQGRRCERVGGHRVDPAQQDRPDPLLRRQRVRQRQQLPAIWPGNGRTCWARPTWTSRSTSRPQPNLTTTGPKTLNRTDGDLLVTFDFTNGGGKPALGLLKWVTSGPTSQCLSSNSLPCWGSRVNLSAAGFAEGAVNTSTVEEPIAGVSLPGLTFGEAAVNLTATRPSPG